MVIWKQESLSRTFTFMMTCGNSYAPTHMLAVPRCLNVRKFLLIQHNLGCYYTLLHIVAVVLEVLPLETHLFEGLFVLSTK